MDEKEFTVWRAEDGLESAQQILAEDHESAAEEWAQRYDADDYPLSSHEGTPERGQVF